MARKPDSPTLARPGSAPALLVSVTDAARMLGVSSRTVWSLLSRGALRPTRIGRAVRVKISDLEALADRGAETC